MDPDSPQPAATANDASAATAADGFIPHGRSTSAGSGWAWIADGFTLFARSWGMWILFAIAMLVISIALSLVPFVGQFAFNLLMPFVVAGAMIGCRAAEKGEDLEIDHFVAGFSSEPGSLVVLGLLYIAATVLIVIAFLLIVGGSIGLAAFAHPEDFMTSLGATAVVSILGAVTVVLVLGTLLIMAYWFAIPLVVFHKVAPVDALKRSFMAFVKNIPPMLVYSIVMFCFMIVASIPLGLGWLVLGPLFFTSAYRSYRDVFVAADAP